MFHAPIILWLTVTHNAPIDHSVFIGMNTAVPGGDASAHGAGGCRRPCGQSRRPFLDLLRAFGQWSALSGITVDTYIVAGIADHITPWQNCYRGLRLPGSEPRYTGPGATRTFDHTRRIVEAAEIEEPIAWPFVYDLVTKTAASEPMVGHTWRERKEIAEGELRAVLKVTSPDAVAGKRILIVDDVFTEGFTIRGVARALILAGASEVSEIVLAREPWKGE
jgi:hypothetical protein